MASDLIAALEQELAGYLRRGLADRAAQVREELRRLGGLVDATIAAGTVPAEPAETNPKKAATRARKPVEPSEEPEAPKTTKTARKGRT